MNEINQRFPLLNGIVTPALSLDPIETIAGNSYRNFHAKDSTTE